MRPPPHLGSYLHCMNCFLRRTWPVILSACAVLVLAGCRSMHPATLASLALPAQSWSSASRALVLGAAEHRLQVLVSEVVEGRDGKPALRRHGFRVDAEYFYPASTIKLGAAVVALQELEVLEQRSGASGLLNAPLEIAPLFPGDAPQVDEPGFASGSGAAAGVSRVPLSVGRELRKLALVSDNQAFNRLFDLVGHEALNQRLHALGLSSVVVNHRLSETRAIPDPLASAAVTLRPPGRPPLEIPARQSSLALSNTTPGLRLGQGVLQGDTVVPGPMDFTRRNRISLLDLQNLLVKLARPDIALPGAPLELTPEHRAFLLRAMTEYPAESADPIYPAAEYPDAYSKFLLPGVRRVFPETAPDRRVEITGKIGRAYGFSIENAYLRHPTNGRSVFVTAALYTNADGILNDDQYEYVELADPFLADLGEWVARRWLTDAR